MNTPAPPQVEPLSDDELAEYSNALKTATHEGVFADATQLHAIRGLLATITQLQAEIATWKERVDVLATEIDELRNQQQSAPVGEDALANQIARIIEPCVSGYTIEFSCAMGNARSILAHLTKLGWGKRG